MEGERRDIGGKIRGFPQFLYAREIPPQHQQTTIKTRTSADDDCIVTILWQLTGRVGTGRDGSILPAFADRSTDEESSGDSADRGTRVDLGVTILQINVGEVVHFRIFFDLGQGWS